MPAGHPGGQLSVEVVLYSHHRLSQARRAGVNHSAG